MFKTTIAVAAVISGAAHAATIQASPPLPSDTVSIVTVTGQLELGDSQKFDQAIAALPVGRPTLVALNSPGGNVLEGERLAVSIRHMRLPVIVDDKAICASACFTIFAASPYKAIVAGARLGVHSTSVKTQDDPAGATFEARNLAAYGVPPAVLGKMVVTPADQIAWLTSDDLQAMQAKIVTPTSAPPAPAPIPATVTPPPTPSAQLAATTSSGGSRAYWEGRGARQAWENWFAGLAGEYKAGADYWAAHRSLPNPGTCGNPSSSEQTEWWKGCTSAKAFLYGTDIRRKTEPDYRLGWNSV